MTAPEKQLTRVRRYVGFALLAVAGAIELIAWNHLFHSSDDSNAGCPGAAFTLWELVPHAILACWVTAFVLLVVGGNAPKRQTTGRLIALVLTSAGGFAIWAMMRVGCLS